MSHQHAVRQSSRWPKLLYLLLAVLFLSRSEFSVGWVRPPWIEGLARPSICHNGAGRSCHLHIRATGSDVSEDDIGVIDANTSRAAPKAGVSKTAMLKFAVPALGIYLAAPLMGNVDNAFVGRFSGTSELAALSPGTVVANNLLFLFAAILNSATTGLVARAWSGGSGNDVAARVRAQLSRTMSVAWVIGVSLTAFYAFATPWAIRAIGTPTAIVGKASLYARITGLSSWAAIAQGVCLSALLSTRDAVTPLRVVLSAQMVNFIGDFLLCCWPLRTGIVGAATATAFSTLVGFCLMVRALLRKQFFPRPRLPSRTDVQPVLEYAGPLFVITAARIVGFSAMALTAATLGTAELAAYQVIISIFVVFVFVSAPLSQNAQTLLPSLVDKGDSQGLRRTFANILILANVVGVVTSALYYASLRFGGSAFTSDLSVLGQVSAASLSSLVPVATLLVLSSVDGAMTAAKDFHLIVIYQLLAVAVQLLLLTEIRRRGLGLSFIFWTLTVRLWICAGGATLCILAGIGRLGKAMALRKRFA